MKMFKKIEIIKHISYSPIEILWLIISFIGLIFSAKTNYFLMIAIIYIIGIIYFDKISYSGD